MTKALAKRECVALVKAPRQWRRLHRVYLDLPEPRDYAVQLDPVVDEVVRALCWQLSAEHEVS